MLRKLFEMAVLGVLALFLFVTAVNFLVLVSGFGGGA